MMSRIDTWTFCEKFGNRNLKIIITQFFILTFVIWTFLGNFKGSTDNRSDDTLLLLKIFSNSKAPSKSEDIKVQKMQDRSKSYIRLRRESRRPVNRFDVFGSNQDLSAPSNQPLQRGSSIGENLPGYDFQQFQDFPTQFTETSTVNQPHSGLGASSRESSGGDFSSGGLSPHPANTSLDNPYLRNPSGIEDNFTYYGLGSMEHGPNNNFPEGEVSQIRDKSSFLPPTVKNVSNYNSSIFSPTVSTESSEQSYFGTTSETQKEIAEELTTIVQSISTKPYLLSKTALICVVVAIVVVLIVTAVITIYLVKVKWKPRRRIDIEKAGTPDDISSTSASTATWHTSHRTSIPTPPIFSNEINGRRTPINAWASANGRNISVSS